MHILKRNGNLETLSFDKILKRIKNITNDKKLGKIKGIDPDVVSQKVINRIYDKISSKELDELSAQISISMSIDHPGYGELASRIVVSNSHKETPDTFMEAVEVLYTDNILNKKIYDNSKLHREKIQEVINNTRDYLIDYFGYKTLQRSYLLRNRNGDIIERPQYMWMRVAVSLHADNIENILETYELLSQKYFTHASPTLFNAGTNREQNSSCYLIGTEDSLEGIFKTMTDCAKISKYAGGIGLHVSNIRAKNTKISGTNGKSDGIVPMLKTYNEISRYINQGGKRNGSFAVYLEPFHADILEFLELRKNSGDVNLRARDLFYALWVCDLFMKKVEQDEDWYLFCPNECPGLCETYGDEFEQLYCKYVEENRMKSTIKARVLWEKILTSQIETGMPYMAYKDNANRKSNQKNVGVIKSSNLCCEIFLYSDNNSTAVCNIATIGLPMFVGKGGKYDYKKLGEITRVLVRNLNNVIDVNFYPTPESEQNNKDHRPIAIGVQGLYDVFVKMRFPFESPEAAEVNRKIFECIQYHAIDESCEIAKKTGPYKTYIGSPISQGIFQHNMWDVDESTLVYDWETLRQKVIEHGVKNSLLTALPPTASTSQILGNTESFEVITSNIYMRRVMGGNFPIINKHLVKDLIDAELWSDRIKDKIILDNGSVQNIEEIPEGIKKLYKTSWETSQKTTIGLSADRAPFIDHSQSLNIFMEVPTISKLSSAHFYGWKRGLKTGMYYLRSKPASTAEKFSVQNTTVITEQLAACSVENKENCEMCSG